MVLGKFFASFTMFGGATLFTSLYFLILVPYAPLKIANLVGNVVALLLVGMVFVAIGLFVSSLTENQLSSAVGTIAIILVLLGFGMIAALLPSNYWLRYIFDAISIFTRFQTFTNGYFDLASTVYYLSVAAVFLYLTVRVYDRVLTEAEMAQFLSLVNAASADVTYYDTEKMEYITNNFYFGDVSDEISRQKGMRHKQIKVSIIANKRRS